MSISLIAACFVFVTLLAVLVAVSKFNIKQILAIPLVLATLTGTIIYTIISFLDSDIRAYIANLACSMLTLNEFVLLSIGTKILFIVFFFLIFCVIDHDIDVFVYDDDRDKFTLSIKSIIFILLTVVIGFIALCLPMTCNLAITK